MKVTMGGGWDGCLRSGDLCVLVTSVYKRTNVLVANHKRPIGESVWGKLFEIGAWK